ncbi:MAG: GNAT family N-acetyltransferase [Promethearchaeota archaeon]
MTIRIRRAKRKDIPWIVHHRIEMFRSMGYASDVLTKGKSGIESFMDKDWDDTIEYFLATIGGNVLGGCAVTVYSVLPNPKRAHTSKIACVHNMFVEPQFRRQGIATALMKHVLSHCRTKGIFKATLHATKMSLDLYRKLGFVKNDDCYELLIKPL